MRFHKLACTYRIAVEARPGEFVVLDSDVAVIMIDGHRQSSVAFCSIEECLPDS